MTAPRLTPDAIEAMIASVEYIYAPTAPTLTLCILVLHNGCTVVGQSNVISPENYDEELGRMAARSNAVNQIWQLEGYAMKRGLTRAEAH